jgi:SMODS domain-containing protein
MSLSVSEAFAALKSNLEVKPEDEQLAIKRRGDIHDRLKKDIDLLSAPVLTGSFHRDTKTRPLKDVDFFCPIRRSDENVSDFLEAPPSVVLAAFAESLRKRYGDRVSVSRRSVGVDFGSEDSRILSYDIVPAFERGEGSGYEIPDAILGRWIGSDPREHRIQATDANKACEGKWKPLVKMIKRANGQIAEQTGRKAIKPSFLIEVMGLELIVPPLGDWPEELQAAFATHQSYVEEKWADPSGLGPPVNEMDVTQQAHAREQLKIAQEVAQDARHLARKSDRQAIMKWRELFGSYMPLD